MTFNYKISKEINWLMESILLMTFAARYKGKFDKEQFSLIKNGDTILKYDEKVESTLSKVRQFSVNILEEAVPMFRESSRWHLLASSEKIDVFEVCYLLDLVVSTNKVSFSDISYNEFMAMNLNIFSDLFFKSGLMEGEYKTLQEGYFGKTDLRDENLVIDLGDIYKLLEPFAFSEEKKWAILSIYANPEEFYNEFKAMTVACEKIIKKHMVLVQDILENTYEKFNDIFVQKQLEEALGINVFKNNITEELKKKIGDNQDFTIYAGLVGYGNGFLKIHSGDPLYMSVYAGVLKLLLYNYEQQSERIKDVVIEQTKALGDTMRFEVIRLLMDRPYYVKELAERLGVSSASLSHHLAILYDAGFISPMVQDRKTYYKVRREKFRELGDYFIGLSE